MNNRGQNDRTCLFELLAQKVDDGCYTYAAPDSVGIEGARIGIVALTRLHGRLIQIDDNSQSRHEEEEEYYPELADACLVGLGTVVLGQRLPEETDESQNEG